MPFLRSYDHDIFVSYAHGPIPSGSYSGERKDQLSRWTQTLIDDLRARVDSHLATKDSARRVNIWMDPRLEGNLDLTTNLQRKVERSAVLLVVMSRFYLASKWCMQEAAWFAETATQRVEGSGRIFVVRAYPTDESLWPNSLKGQTGVALPGYFLHPPAEPHDLCEPYGYPKPDDADREYNKAVSHLAVQITKQLQDLAWLEDNPVPNGDLGVVPDSVGRRVFIGYMNESLTEDGMRAALHDALAKERISVCAPAEDMPKDELSLRQALETYLPQAEAIVLVANQYRGSWPGGGVIGLQLEYAKAKNIPTYLWLKLSGPSEIKLDEYRLYIEQLQEQAIKRGLKLYHETLDDFISYVRDKLDESEKPEPGVERLAVVCSNHAGDKHEHEKVLEAVRRLMDERLLPSWIAPVDPETGQVRFEKIKEALDKADTILIICFDQNYDWALRLWGQLKSCKLMSSPQAKRIFLIGPKDVGAGDCDLPRFSKVMAINGNSLGSLDKSL